MREIDLIPREHRQARQLMRWLGAAGLAAAALVAATALARIAIAAGVAKERPAVARLQHDAQAAATQRAELVALAQRKEAVEARLDALQRLRQPTGWGPALRSIDAAFGPGLWFDQLTVSPAPASPASATASAPTAAGASTLEIKGHAIDHGGVMDFIRRLGEQPALRSVRLADTAVRRYSVAEVIDFTVTARVDAVPESAP